MKILSLGIHEGKTTTKKETWHNVSQGYDHPAVIQFQRIWHARLSQT